MLSCAIACGKDSGGIAETSTSTTSTTSTTSDGSTTTTAVVDDTTSTGDATSSEASSSAATSSGGETGVRDCGVLETEDECEASGCNVEHGEAFAWDDATGVCTSLGPTFVCHASPGVVTAPAFYWRAVEAEIELVRLNNAPFDLPGWDPCGCGPGDAFACYGCDAGLGCSVKDTCGDSLDAESCAARPGGDCVWAETTTYEGEGTSCEAVSSGGRCVIGLVGKASCEIVTPPRDCAWTEDAPPYVRPIDGGVERLYWTTCETLPHGYMPCWSAVAGDPAACDCAC